MTQNSPPNREKEIFEQALDLESAEERVAFVKGACGADAAMLDRLLALLRASEGASAFLPEEPKGAAAMKLNLPQARDEAVGQKLGRYKLLERIGEGGCGVVYVAEQTEPVRRRVALKVVKLGMDTKQVVARFEAERQALAMMDHPNIARVLDAGTTESGRPYFVMELVRGIKITDYCDQNNLPTPDRLDLFIKVCQAIQHAHQKGIIHRDIKPSNLLVTLHDGVPVPKVIDFGIAKAIPHMRDRLTDATVYTRLQQFIGTPAYMSPEQAEMSGLDIDTRSDIYSLGVLLYELLAGSPPFDPKELIESGIDQMRRTIREKEPVRPSTRLAALRGEELTSAAKRRSAEAPKLIHQLKGDLDWIVMKCLEKDRQRRYETASSIANDLQRHLKNEPVIARPPSAGYRLQKAFRRNRLAFTAGIAVAAALLLGFGVSIWQAIKATNAKDAEVRQRIAAEKAEARAAAQQKKAEEQLTRAEWLVYAGKLMMAQNDFENGNGGLARHYLSECQEKLRGWEWRYLWNRVNAQLTLTGHTAVVLSAAFSPDGTRLLTSGAWDQTARVWDANTGEQLLTLQGHKQHVYCAAFSPDGQWIVTGAGLGGAGLRPGEAKVWDAATGRQRFELPGHNYSVAGVAISRDGQRIATAAAEGAYRESEVKIWDAATGQELLSLPFTGNVRCVAFSPDGQRFVTGDQSKLEVRNVASGDKLLTIKAHPEAITSVAFSPDGQRILSSSWDRTARVWDAATGGEIFALKGHANVVMSAAFSSDGRRIVTGSRDQTTKIWDAATAREIFTLKGHSAMVRSVAFSPDGKHVVTASEDKTAKVWDAERGQEIPMLRGHRGSVNGFAFTSDSKRLVSGSDDGTAKVWNLATGQEVLSLRHRTRDLHFGSVWTVASSPDGRRIVTGGFDHSAKVWDVETGQEFLVLDDHTNAVLGVAFSPDGRRIVAAVGWYGEQRPGEVKVWDAATGQLQVILQQQPAWSVAFSPDGGRIVAGNANGTIRMWNAPTGQELFAIKGHKGGVGGVAFSADGQRIVTGSHDHTAKVWNAETGQELLTLKGHTDHVRCVAFSPDGQRIVTGGDDRSVRVWEAATGLEVFVFKGHADGEMVRCIAFSPDGQHLVAGTGPDVRLRVWSAAPRR